MARDEQTQTTPAANPGYATLQLARALQTSEEHDDADTRERARAKMAKWMKVLEGMMAHSLAIGSRQPMRDAPVWATPEVMMGGFATGGLLAGGALQPHEMELARRVAPAQQGEDRTALNICFLSENGLAELTALLESGCFEIKTPEEGALLAVAWLTANGHRARAHELLDEIAPHFARLRFYPAKAERPASFGARVFLESAGTVLERLRRIQPNPRIMTQREAIDVWAPLYERMIGQFLETVEGETPVIVPDAEGRWISAETKRFYVSGGWPCRRFEADWIQRAGALVSEIECAQLVRQQCSRANRKGDSFPRLLGCLKICARDPAALTGRDVGMIRLILARHATKCGAPGSAKSGDGRALQQAQVAGPLHHEIAAVVMQRLAELPADRGVDEVESLVQPVAAREAERASLRAGVAIPESICLKVARCLCDTVDVLVARGIVTSGETLARVIPQFTAALRALAFDSPKLRSLYAAIYAAFRRRRSLLLLNFEKQVQIEELPWVAALEPLRRKDSTDREVARQTLKEVAVLTLREFPQAIIPNKLLQEFRALAKGAELNLPLVEELAADIFMDDFTPKFTEAARQATAMLDSSLYARYYGVDCGVVLSLPDWKPGKRVWSWFERSKPENPFAALCIARAEPDETKRWDVARNGMVIEQSQILTTHNLAVLFQAFDLASELRPHLREMTESCFRWVCHRQQAKTDNWHAKLIMLKNAAYAWRQMIFYLSHLSGGEAASFVVWADEHLSQASAEFANRFAPALRGLALSIEGRTWVESPDARRFLGWTQKRHWLLGAGER